MEQQNLWQFMIQQHDKLIQQTLEHIGLTFISLFLALLIALPLGIWIARKPAASPFVLGISGVLQTIPSIALLGFMIPLLGIGWLPAITALFLYALLPIIRNTYTGITGIDPSIKEAAVAMGMNHWQVLWKIELPLAFPVIMAGIRTATVINVGVATLAAYIAAGGLGEFIFGGIALNSVNMILAGAIPSALLAILLDFLLSLVQHIDLKKLRFALWLIPLICIAATSSYFFSGTQDLKLKAGFTPEFMGRTDGDLGLKSIYKLDIKPVVISDAVMYKAAFDKKLDVISGYGTDGRLKAYNLVILKDDKKIFPPYYAAPLVRNEALIKFPELEKVLNLLAGRINDSIMTDLNYRVDYLHQSPQQVAKDFLVKAKLWRNPLPAGSQTVRIGSKIFGEQYILAAMYGMLIRGNTRLNVYSKTGLGGTQICFNALKNNEIDFYPEYTGTGLLVLLHPSKQTLSRVTKSNGSTYNFVKQEFDKTFQMKWLKPIGFNNTYALMMRRQQSSELQIQSISDLKRYLDQ
ncbi:ABC transporter permease/substrate-binding protein [Arcticibacter eurypsychrophilus]|uniref:ABC transporter permease/substrate-binding protein n=1 Tax=Arcticibacter eurypsychrophilus TaxID=1434752 RepID=UPI00084D15B8|nr:ABC transporter permease/substrate-binding protein [Arcticibacter eurypsychrophilus]